MWSIGYETADAQHIVGHLEANTQATLALAYEQRTANLIAIYALEDAWQLALNRNAGMTPEKWDGVANQIVERLGLK